MVLRISHAFTYELNVRKALYFVGAFILTLGVYMMEWHDMALPDKSV